MDLVKLNTFCAVFYFHGASLSRFLTSLQITLGFSASTIGDILGFMRIATSFLSPTISALADTKKIHRRLVISQSISRVVPFMVMWYMYCAETLSVTSFWILNSMVSVIGSGCGPMTDSLVLASLDDESRYGKVRLWGALTYGVGSLVLGALIQTFGDYNPMFAMSLITVVPAVASVYYILPAFASDTKPACPLSFASVRQLLTHSSAVKVFFLNSIVIGAALSLVESLLFVAMARAMDGSSPFIAGASVLVSVVCEIPIFQLAPSLISRWGHKRMLIIANIAWIVRALGYAVFTSAWVVLVLEILHGVTFGLYFSAAVDICVKHSPPGMESTMQSLLDMTFNGLGVALGTIGGGYLFDAIGSPQTFLLYSGVVAVSTIALYFVFVETQASELSQELTTAIPSD
jgi:PPP family 3-phenylpropionic acid transporter